MKHTFAHFGYVTIVWGLGEHISGQDFIFRSLPANIFLLNWVILPFFLGKNVFSKNGRFGQFGQTIGQCGQFHMNHLEILF